jgi:spore maturation protein CgeB
MNVLIIQEASRHVEDAQFRECMALKRAFSKHNISSTVWGLGHPNFNDVIDFTKWDVILNLENYGDDWLPDLSKIKKPYKIMWSIDAHVRGVDAYKYIFEKDKYNLMLQSTMEYAVYEPNTVWFPNSYCDEVITNLYLEKTTDICFVGNYVNRFDIINNLIQKYNLQAHIGLRGFEMVKAINQSKIHFNKNIANDINYRNFETIGCGTLLITNYNEAYDKLGFKDMHNVVFYKNISELHDKLDLLIKNDHIIDMISNNGYELSNRHTYFNRVGKLIKLLKKAV